MSGVQFVFSEEVSQAVDALLESYLRQSKSRCVLLISKSGHLINQFGFTNTFSVQPIAALIGGIFTSTQSLARLVAEEKFSMMFQEGRNWNVYLSLLADQFILAAIFDKTTVIGMIRHAAGEIQHELEPQLLKALVAEEETPPAPAATFTPAAHPFAAAPGQPADAELPDFNKAVEDALSKLFA
ncbi:MAG: roadblock/LC7 domain-containing protein [Candidatus Edwardsbacteria bacterium]|nr:roadblock/LC7 domain-containing protein [Candidatus Edwardsbacteria bacterium]